MNNELAEWIVKAIETIKSGVVDELVKYLEDLKSKAEATKELREENELLKNSDSLCKLIGEQKLKITDLENKLANADYQLEGRDIKIRELEAQIEKMKRCSNCKYGYCPTSYSSQKDRKVLFHNWNKEKQAYCDSGNGEGEKYQLWEIKEK